MRKWLILAALLVPSLASAQLSRYNGTAFSNAGRPLGGVNVAVCSFSATNTAQPCTPLASIYQDAAGTIPQSNPFQADGGGNYGFWVASGNYQLQIYGNGITGTFGPITAGSGGAGNITLTGTNGQAAVQNGTSSLVTVTGNYYCNIFGGSTPDAQINACITAANAANSAADMSAFAGLWTNFAGEIDGGDPSSGNYTSLILPCKAHWQFTLTGGTQDLLKTWTPFSISNKCGPTERFSMTLENISSSGGANALWEQFQGAGSNTYWKANGFYLQNHSGHALASCYDVLLTSGNDATEMKDVHVFDSNTATGGGCTAGNDYVILMESVIGGSTLCCGMTLRDDTADAGFGHKIPLAIIAPLTSPTTTPTPYAINIDGGSYNHPGPNVPSEFFQDQNTLKKMTIDQTGSPYFEPNNSGSTSQAVIYLDGVSMFHVSSGSVHCQLSGFLGPFVQSTNAFNTDITVDGFKANTGSIVCGTLTSYPAVVNGFTGNTYYTNSTGEFGVYHSHSEYSDSNIQATGAILGGGATAVTTGVNAAGFGNDSNGSPVFICGLTGGCNAADGNYIRFSAPNATGTGVFTQFSSANGSTAGGEILDISPISPGSPASLSETIRFCRTTNTSGNCQLVGLLGNNSTTQNWQLSSNGNTSFSTNNGATYVGANSGGTGLFNAGTGSSFFTVDSSANIGQPSTSTANLGNVKAYNLQFAVGAGGSGLLLSPVAPTIASGFTTGTITVGPGNGSAATTILLGTGTMSNTGVITLPANTHGWNCSVSSNQSDALNNRASHMVQTAFSTTSVTFQEQTASTGTATNFNANDLLLISCFGF